MEDHPQRDYAAAKLELLECCWKQPITQKEQEACSGWLVHNWHKEKYMYLRDTKN